MKHCILLFTLTLSLTAANAQFAETLWSEPRENAQGWPILNLDRNENNGYVFALFANDIKKPSSFRLEKYSNTLDTAGNIDFKLPARARFLTSSRNHIFATETSIAKMTHSVMVFEATQGEIEPITLISVPITDTVRKGEFKISFSPTGEYYSVLYEHPGIESENENITVGVFDKYHKQVFAKQLSLDVTHKKNIHNYIFCTNHGTAYLVKKDRDKNVFRYLVYAINSETSSMVGKPVGIGGKHITDIRAMVNERGHICITGFTSSEPVHEYTGYFLFSFDENLTQVLRCVSAFSDYTLEQCLGKKFDKDPVIRNYYIDRMVLLSNGTMCVLAEEHTQVKTDKKEEHLHGNVLVLMYGADGKFYASHCIKKTQNTAALDMHFGSYAHWTKSDTLYLAYNDVSAELINKAKKQVDAAKAFLKTHIAVIPSGASQPVITDWIQDFEGADVAMAFATDALYTGENKQIILRFASPGTKMYRLGIATLK